MKLSTVIVGLLLAFLLFTPQGQFIGEAVMLKAMTPAPDPAKVAAVEGLRRGLLRQGLRAQAREELYPWL